MPVPLKTRVLLADDHQLVREGLKLVLDSQPDLSVVAEAGDGAEALEAGMTGEIDLAVQRRSAGELRVLDELTPIHEPR